MAAKGQTLWEFGELYPAERKLLAACRDGEAAIIAESRPEKLTPENHVRAAFVRFLARGGDGDAPVHEAGINLIGAVVMGELDLSGATVPFPLLLRNCFFQTEKRETADLSLRGSVFNGGLRLSGSRLNRIFGNGLRAKDAVDLGLGFHATGEVWLIDAEIAGTLQCSGGRFTPLIGEAALCFDRAKILGAVFLNKDFEATGEVRFLGAEIGGVLDCRQSRFNPTHGYALSFDGAKITGSVFLKSNFFATGMVRFPGATIGGNLECDSGNFDPNNGDALVFDMARVSGSVHLKDGFHATGLVRFVGAEIGGSLGCLGGIFEPKKGVALGFDGAKISGSVFLGDGFRAAGEVRLLGARIEGDLEFDSGKFMPNGGRALCFEQAKISGSVFLRDGFQANGAVELALAEIGGSLNLSGAVIEKGFDANHVVVKHRFLLEGLPRKLSGANLIGFKCSSLKDDETSWGEGNLLNGFVYDSLAEGTEIRAEKRVAWLKQQASDTHGFQLQPWKQLQKALTATGHFAEVRAVRIALEDERRDRRIVGPVYPWKQPFRKLNAWMERRIHALYGIFTGYGYEPLRLLYCLISLWIIGGFIYSGAAMGGLMGPANPMVFQNKLYKEKCGIHDDDAPSNFFKTSVLKNWYYCNSLPSDFTTLSPFAYSLDLLLPLVDLYQDKDWGIRVQTPLPEFWEELSNFSAAHWLRLFMWFQILFGWMASLMFVSIVSGIARFGHSDE